jgi:hypothetical protein
LELLWVVASVCINWAFVIYWAGFLSHVSPILYCYYYYSSWVARHKAQVRFLK